MYHLINQKQIKNFYLKTWWLYLILILTKQPNYPLKYNLNHRPIF